MEVSASAAVGTGGDLETKSRASAVRAVDDDVARAFHLSGVLPTEHARLMTWLNDGLRRGCDRRLENEFPTALPNMHAEPDLERHVVVRHHGDFASHAFAHTSQVEARGTRTTLGMIGMVYTHADFRGHGAAQLAVENAVQILRSRGASLAILWSHLDTFYGRLGFHRAGIENSYRLDASVCNALHARIPVSDRPALRSPRDDDWSQLEALYLDKPVHQLRAQGELRRLASAPESCTLVATRDGRPIAYACMGRGDDLAGVVHEWAGEAKGLVTCLHEFVQSREEIALLEGPIREPATLPLREAGVPQNLGTLGLMRILDAESLFDTIAGGEARLRGMRLVQHPLHRNAYTFSTPRSETTLSHQSALCLLFGAALPRSLQLALEDRECDALRLRFPWPLFVWGFDSI